MASNYQSRVLAPFRKHAQFWEVLSGDLLKNGFPEREELRKRLGEALGLLPAQRETTPRLQLHRALTRIISHVPEAANDTTVGQAFILLRQAMATLEQGRVAA